VDPFEKPPRKFLTPFPMCHTQKTIPHSTGNRAYGEVKNLKMSWKIRKTAQAKAIALSFRFDVFEK
jgi:hypothetical protein